MNLLNVFVILWTSFFSTPSTFAQGQFKNCLFLEAQNLSRAMNVYLHFTKSYVSQVKV